MTAAVDIVRPLMIGQVPADIARPLLMLTAYALGGCLAYKTVRGELKAYGGNLVRKKEVVALNKTDAMTPEDIEAKRAKLAKASRKAVHVISGVAGHGVQALLHELMKLVDRQRDGSKEAA